MTRLVGLCKPLKIWSKTYLSIEIISFWHYKVITEFRWGRLSFFTYKNAYHYTIMTMWLYIPAREKFENPVSPRPEVSLFIEVNGVNWSRSMTEKRMIEDYSSVGSYLPESFSYLLIRWRRLGLLRWVNAVVVARAWRGAAGFIRFIRSSIVPLIPLYNWWDCRRSGAIVWSARNALISASIYASPSNAAYVSFCVVSGFCWAWFIPPANLLSSGCIKLTNSLLFSLSLYEFL